MSQVVLITGCSSGIGRDVAQRLARAGYTVAATARKVDDLEGLDVAAKLPLDVTEEETITGAVAFVRECFGRIDVLVNNAGYAVRGAVEDVSAEQAQAIFDANVFGVMRTIRAVAPVMREQRSGRIINLSSIVGKLVIPGNGVYSATKYAVEALSDALRWELAGFGIQVVVIEPGSIKTRFLDNAGLHSQRIVANPASPYRALYERSESFGTSSRGQEPGPEVVSQVIQQAIEAPNPKARYTAGIGFTGILSIALRDMLWDTVIRKMFKIN